MVVVISLLGLGRLIIYRRLQVKVLAPPDLTPRQFTFFVPFKYHILRTCSWKKRFMFSVNSGIHLECAVKKCFVISTMTSNGRFIGAL